MQNFCMQNLHEDFCVQNLHADFCMLGAISLTTRVKSGTVKEATGINGTVMKFAQIRHSPFNFLLSETIWSGF